MNHLLLPSGDQLHVGDVVTLSRFPGTKWIVQNGWYFCEGRQENGWYFASIPTNSVIPVDESDLLTLTIISTNGTHACPPFHPGSPECNPHPHPHHPHHPCHPTGPDPNYLNNKAMITVDTITERNSLPIRGLQHGRIVRVNEVQGKLRYFEWDALNLKWIDAQLGDEMIKTMESFSKDLIISSEEDWNSSDDKLPTCKAIEEHFGTVSGLEWGTIQ